MNLKKNYCKCFKISVQKNENTEQYKYEVQF